MTGLWWPSQARPPTQLREPTLAATSSSRRSRAINGQAYYAGRFSPRCAHRASHHANVPLFPDWPGHDQVRGVAIGRGQLSISASDRTAVAGGTFHSELIWLSL